MGEQAVEHPIERAKPKLLVGSTAYAGTQVSNTWAAFVQRVCLPNTTER
jgi:hypothetical protein